VLRLGAILGAFGVAAAVMWFTQAGRDFVVFSRESWEEAKRVVWPTRKETTQMTLVVVAMVILVSLFLWVVDWGLLTAVKALTGQRS